jgi:hypothetical protein
MSTLEEKLAATPIQITTGIVIDENTFQPYLKCSFNLPLELAQDNDARLPKDQAIEIIAEHLKQQFINLATIGFKHI